MTNDPNLQADAGAKLANEIFDLRPVNHDHPLFEPIWQAIKSWDVGRDGGRHGYHGATGTDVQIILDSIAAAESHARALIGASEVRNG